MAQAHASVSASPSVSASFSVSESAPDSPNSPNSSDSPAAPAPAFDLDAYLARIGWSGERRATAETLRSLQRAHLVHIPFENIQAFLGGAPSLALPDLEAKLVRGNRGGYCYEHNTLFAAVLEAFGFTVTRLTARVLVGARPGETRPRTHKLLLVTVTEGDERGPFVADVGFGSTGSLYEAIPLVADAEVRAGQRRHRLVLEPHGGPLEMWVLQSVQDGEWEDQYSFTVEPFEPADYEVINWHIATNPRSPFQHQLYVQRTFVDRHLALVGRKVEEILPDGTRTRRELADGAEVVRVLASDFGIALPADVTLPV
ncbi:arylamine N-acetyltransferase [Streptomyces sp. SAJ15]|uniref:arylamine N-acetyltransferase family protein n=1 Tax=Streptomyces sp. SAJ15 TaxID=2011095 RepID=UPI001185519A|nr:arylamine N-acetyltransferase [Streptomyces sp. SAJ15]TVL91439.1 arylamine N-acetyltransferase [Streptomyces sp. SAJ15]